MKIPVLKRRPAFETLPRHKRSQEVIRLKGMMRRDTAEYGGRFTSRLLLNELDRPELYNQWFDFYFPGSDRFTIWNASVVTARKAFWGMVNDIAYSRASAMLRLEELAANSKVEYVPAQRSKAGKVLFYQLAEREEKRFGQFDGLTFREQWRKLESEIARNEPPLIFESFTTDRSYAYGIGLKIILDVDEIKQSSIEAAIDRFMDKGETDCVSSEPVSRERLPVVSEHDALGTLTFPAE